MFYYINGNLAHLESNMAVLDVGGVGYKLTISGTTYEAMPPRSHSNPPTVKLFTYLAVREDDMELFGFATQTELASFKMLISVSGVGPKLGISVLTGLSADELTQAIATADVKRLSAVKGLGKKTAEKIVLELHGKISAAEVMNASGDNLSLVEQAGAFTTTAEDEEAISALMGLGFTKSESVQAVKRAREHGAVTVEDIIRKALAFS